MSKALAAPWRAGKNGESFSATLLSLTVHGIRSSVPMGDRAKLSPSALNPFVFSECDDSTG